MLLLSYRFISTKTYWGEGGGANGPVKEKANGVHTVEGSVDFGGLLAIQRS